MLQRHQGWGVLSKIHVEFYVIWQGCSDMVFDWLTANTYHSNIAYLRGVHVQYRWSGAVSYVHDSVKWKQFPCYGTFVWGIHRSRVNSPHKGQWRGTFMFSFLRQKKRLSKRAWDWWFETPLCSLWYHCNGLSAPRALQWIKISIMLQQIRR